MHTKIEELELIILSDWQGKQQKGLGFKVNGISFSLTLEQVNSLILHYVDSRCLIHHEGVEFLISAEDTQRMKAKIQELKNDVFLTV